MAESANLRDDLDVWLSWWRDAILVRAGNTGEIANLDRQETLWTICGRLSLEEIVAQTQRLRATVRAIDQNVNARLALENLLMDLPSLPEAVAVR
jgi:hypothetical protein